MEIDGTQESGFDRREFVQQLGGLMAALGLGSMTPASLGARGRSLTDSSKAVHWNDCVFQERVPHPSCQVGLRPGPNQSIREPLGVGGDEQKRLALALEANVPRQR